jgi:Raf kinase inhibitor-like YbhB/YbcL family protein
MLSFECKSYKESIPHQFTHHSIKGKNLSPAFSWHDAPVSTKSFALSIVDPHPVAKNWVHWMLVDIPFSAREIPEGASRTGRMPKGARELMNTYGEQGYGGPAPPVGSGAHPYIATLYALNVEKLQLPHDASLRQFLKSVDGKIIEEAATKGFYEEK